ncbi:related to Importin beta-like protein KAP120 [Saccharomycodes ludwigii]|uniref:Related to Importin beta-like protein KAP120 n=2 Tax=Saccharomycodes ludwigii TaxID=36035 RepID=A0A376B3N6_9ASCO|nr:related to Importin beta-like protein KAP120 [Saccharomycodes ludwigii]
MNISIQHFEILLNNYDQCKLRFDQYEKFVKCFGKLYFNFISGSPTNFVMLPCSKQILISLITLLINKAPQVYNENTEENDFWEQISIRGLLILKKTINFLDKKGAITIKSKNDKNEINFAISVLKSKIFTPQMITEFMDVLINWYLKLRPIELENWKLDPEEWISEQIATSYEYQVRPCAENFFKDFMHVFKATCAPYLLNKIENSSSQVDFLTRDALFASFQLSCNSITDIVDFNKLLVTVFLPQVNPNNYNEDELKIIIRRVCLIINDWCEVQCSQESRVICYDFLAQLLTSSFASNDKVIQLTAISCLRTMIDDWNFEKDKFQPFLEKYVNILLRNILPQVSMTQTRLYVLETICDLIIKTKPLIDKTTLVEILQIIPPLWEATTSVTNTSATTTITNNEFILSNVLLRLLKNLVISLGEHSHLTWEISIPIVEMCCNPSSPNYTLLYEDGFELWHSLINNYPLGDNAANGIPQFTNLLPYLLNGVEDKIEILPTLLEIMKSYILVIPNIEDILKIKEFYAISTILSTNILKLRDDSFELILSIWDIIIVKYYGRGDHDGNTDISNNMLFNWFYNAQILSNLTYSIFLVERLSDYQLSQLFNIIARLSFEDFKLVIQFLSTYQLEILPAMDVQNRLPLSEREVVFKEMAFSKILEKFLIIWLQSFNSMYDPKLKKIGILGISKFLLSPQVLEISNMFNSISSLWVEMMEEINELDSGDCEKYHAYDLEEQQYKDQIQEQLPPEYIRLKNLKLLKDPVFTVNLKNFIRELLTSIRVDVLGNSKYNAFITDYANPSILENIQTFLSIRRN